MWVGGAAQLERACLACMRPWVLSPEPERKKEKERRKERRKEGRKEGRCTEYIKYRTISMSLKSMCMSQVENYLPLSLKPISNPLYKASICK
jgi:hypothetical protein